MVEADVDVQQLWKEYKRTGERTLRNALMEFYLPLVRYTAERISAKLPNEVDVEDLVSAGTFGLIDAIEAFDLSRGVKFETYCSPRIRGAILDELRTMDWVPRLVRSRAHKLETATKVLRAELGRLPSNDEIADRLGMDRSEFEKLLGDANAVLLISLSRSYVDQDSDHELQEIDVLADRRTCDPVEGFSERDLRDVVMRTLTEIERLILILYYYEEMTMKEIGATLDLSESRVSQMHSSILARLRGHLRSRGLLESGV
ncbi:MAG TPA: FliA/WhiG family RNA polymerase sigma factor [Phycisphaerae bacterium]|nr:FliA/WhiG family RNA polymerase sigma factor [Phycisphaerae bacterium]HRR86337.1 FliA/WhiG family RNA polymerase sigma factor [Phycisphaerae bacterium]